MLFTHQWEKRSSIRNRPHRHLTDDKSKYFFPPAEQPLCLHPKIIALGDEVKRYVLIQSAYLFMQTIFTNETKVINAIANKIIARDSDVRWPAATRQALLTVIIDETYHAYVANDFVMQIELATGVKPLDFSFDSSLSNALARMSEIVAPEYLDAFEIVVACIAENSITKELISITRDAQVDPLFYQINDDHIVDEGRHCRIFSQILTHLWHSISLDAKDGIGPMLPAFIKMYLTRTIAMQNDRTLLSALPFNVNEIETILYDTYPDFSEADLFAHNPIVKNIMSLLEKSAVLNHENTARAFNVKPPAPTSARLDDTSTDSKNLTVLGHFQRAAQEHPHQLAIVDDEMHITYHELDRMATIVSTNLLSMGLERGAIIAVVHAHSYIYVALILGIMRARMVFMPLARNAPALSLQKVMSDADPNLLVVDDEHLVDSQDDNRRWITSKTLLTHNERWSFSEIAPSQPIDLAYIIFTSGSAGAQKGVMVAHSSLTNFALSIAKTFAIERGDRILQFSPYCFDPSLAEIFGALVKGATLCIRTKNMLDSSLHFFAECRRLDITLLNLPTSLWYQLIRDAEMLPTLLPRNLKTVVIGGEAVKSHQLHHWYKQFPSTIRLLNTYGPTETTIAVTVCDLNDYPGLRYSESLIGTSCAHASLFVLDDNLAPLPAGEIGELYIGGPGVSLGYFKRPDLTKERFLPIEKIFGDSLLYKTGDRVKWLEDPINKDRQLLAFIGRVDRQIKLRGFRVDLEEIEWAINSCQGVVSCRVLLFTKNELEILIAFVVKDPSTFISESYLRSAMQPLLPHYMQPSQFIFIATWPVNSHGKIDDTALLAAAFSPSIPIASPMNDMESCLQDMWKSLLNTSTIDRDSHFFYLGGHSLLAMRLLALINREFCTQLTVRNIYDHPRFGQMITLLEKQHKAIISQSPATNVSNVAPLSYTQEAMWIEDRLSNGASIKYNIAYAIHLREQPHFNPTALELALNHLCLRHTILRTVFEMKDGVPSQIVVERTISLKPEVIALGDLNKAALTEARTPFDLAKDPPFRARLFIIAEHYHVVLINHHHIIHDGYSIGVFLRELQTCYEAYLIGKEPHLQALTLQYADCARRSREHPCDSSAYWLSELDKYRPMHLPYRQQHAQMDSSRGEHYRFSIDAQTGDVLHKLCAQEDCTLFIGLLTVFFLLFYHDSGNSDIAIATMMSTREHEDDFHVIGPFVNAVILRQHVEIKSVFVELMQKVKKKLLEVAMHRFLPIEKITKSMTMNRLNGDHRLFDVMIVFHARDEICATISSPNLQGNVEFIGNNTAKFGLMIDIFEREKTIDIDMQFCPHTFTHTDINEIAKRFIDLLRTTVNHPHIALNTVLNHFTDQSSHGD